MGGALRIFILAWLAVLVGTVSAPASTGNVASDSAILWRTSNTHDRISACRRLAITIPRETVRKHITTRTAVADAAFNVLRDYELRGADREARVRCARWLVNTSATIVPQSHGKSTPYADDAIRVMYRMMQDADPQIRSGAIVALWGVPDPEIAHKLLNVAQTDRSGSVRQSAFENLFWGMSTDLRTNHNHSMYERVIDEALKSSDDETVSGALTAYAGLNGVKADPLLRHYAVDKSAVVRAGAIRAYDSMMAYNASIEKFIESRLSDPDPNVRSEVLLRLLRMGDAHALPAIDRLAKTAPTAAERKEAQSYARSLRQSPQ